MLAKHLESAKFDKMVAAARDYQCDSCLETIEPRPQRPSRLHEAQEFNDTIGMDGFFFNSPAFERMSCML